MSEIAAVLMLADGTTFHGQAFGATPQGDAGQGEVVFHTGMTGYQEILTDPSYAGQIVCMTYPEIGNTGTNPEDEESSGLYLRGFVVRDHVDFPSSWRSRESLDAYLRRHGVPAVSGIDTRALVRRLRTAGAMNGLIAHGAVDLGALRARVAAIPSMAGLNLVDGVTCAKPFRWTLDTAWGGMKPPAAPTPRYHVVAYDYGIKRNILRELVSAGFDVTVVPAQTTAADALALGPDGIFLSNGPADPNEVKYAPPTVRELIRSKPTFGICLGHQILGLALGGSVKKLRFGHHGANQPSKDLTSGRVMIASENHGFAVDMASLAHDPDVEITHVNLNDQTVEGLRHRRWPAFSVQYHPEACPGPHDLGYLFGRFRSLIEEQRQAERAATRSGAESGHA